MGKLGLRAGGFRQPPRNIKHSQHSHNTFMFVRILFIMKGWGGLLFLEEGDDFESHGQGLSNAELSFC